VDTRTAFVSLALALSLTSFANVSHAEQPAASQSPARNLEEALHLTAIVDFAEQGIVRTLDGAIRFCALDPKLPPQKPWMLWVNPASPRNGAYAILVNVAFF